MVTVKKRGVSKKNKSSWRKHVDVSDVDTYLEEKRLEERLGGAFQSQSNSDLFIVDTKLSKSPKKKASKTKAPKVLTKQEKRQKIRESLSTCFPMLQSHSKVPDPIAKRNRVRTKEERKHPLLRKKETEMRLQGKLKAKESQALQNKALAVQKRKNRPKRGEYKSDIWVEDEPDAAKTRFIIQEWLTNDTKRHNLHGLGKTKKSKPTTLLKNNSVLPSIEMPHPGMSYNPSLEDHSDLLNIIAEKEAKLIKTEKHLNRVTKGMFSRVTQSQKDNAWMEEMSQGLPSKEGTVTEEFQSDTEDFKSVNPPVQNKKKTLQQKRKQKEQRILAQSRVIAKKEKKKVADIYKLRKLHQDIAKEAKQEDFIKEKRVKIRAERQKGTKQLSSRKFEEPDLEFKMGSEITGNLRNLKKEGNLLKDRFASLRKRNILEVTAKCIKKKGKVKKYVRSGHKEDWKSTIPLLK